MNELTITEVSGRYNVSPRMLRYYEKEGLISSTRREDYAYRIYDETAVRRLRQILLLRKLRFSLAEIRAILNAASRTEPLRIFLAKITELDEEIAALTVIRDVLRELAHGSRWSPDRLLENEELRLVTEVLPSEKSTLKESHTMNELNRASERAERPEIRILRVPAYTVASYHYVGADPEAKVGDELSRFVKESGLYDIKPDARMFGFNHPNPGVLEEGHGYEAWVTIPDDMEVPAPFVKKRFEGGLYAAMQMKMPDFGRWQLLFDRIAASDEFEINRHPLGDEVMGGLLEEHINWVYDAEHGWQEGGSLDGQLDLLLPVKQK